MIRLSADPETFMKTLLRLEELAIFGLSIYLFGLLPFPWWYLPLLFFVPDISIAAYLAGPRLGAVVYNLIHHRGLHLLIYLAGILFSAPILSLAGIVMFCHSSLDRALGYGLKLPKGFTSTHLGRIGRDRT
jgi:hypothetical protein